MNKKLTNEEFLKRLQKVHPGYTSLSKYQKASVKVTIKCNKGHIFQATPSSLLNGGHSCSICSNIRCRQHQRLTNNEFVEKLRIKHPGYVALEKYVDSKTKIKVKCNQGHIFETTPNNLFNKKIGCPKCALKHLSTINKLSNNEFLKRLQKVHPNYTALEDYRGSDTKIRIQCDQGHIFSVTPASLINQKTGCPICADKQRGQRALMSNKEH